MKIATYNVNGIGARLPVLLRWLDDTKPDVACLQELKAPQENFPLMALQELGYNAIWQGQKSWNGVAILTKNLATDSVLVGLPGNEEDTQSRYIQAEVNGIVVGCLYLPNGNPAPGPKYDYKMQWFKHLQNHAQQLINLGKRVVLLGDYNVIPAEFDVYKPERWVDDALFRVETRAEYEKLIAQGWTDALRKLYPDEKIYTYWDYFRNAFGRDAGLRIDNFLVSPNLVNSLKAGGVDKHVRAWEKSSDHAPVWLEIE